MRSASSHIPVGISAQIQVARHRPSGYRSRFATRLALYGHSRLDKPRCVLQPLASIRGCDRQSSLCSLKSPADGIVIIQTISRMGDL
jgi:hypothetical protein